MKTSLIAGLIFWLLISATTHAESYVCVANTVSGFQFDRETAEWLPVSYGTDTEYLITEAGPQDVGSVSFTPVWVVKDQSDPNDSISCKNDFDESGNLSCNQGWRFHFNKYTLRYLKLNEQGYVTEPAGKLEGDNEPHMEIGTCEALYNE